MPVQPIAKAFSDIGKGLFQGQKAYDEGYNAMAKTMAERSLMEARTRDSDAQAGFHAAKTDEIKRRAEYQTPEALTNLASSFAGAPLPLGAEIENFARTNSWGNNVEALPPDQYGPPQITPKSAPSFATPAMINRYMAARAAVMANMAGTGNSDSNNIAQAFINTTKQAQIDQALASGGVQGLNGLEAARKGDLYKFAEFGTGDQSTGKVAFNQPYLDKNASEIATRRAQAGAAAASANNANASAEYHRTQTEAARLKMSQPQVIVGPNGETAVLDPKTGLPMGTPKPSAEYLKQQAGVQNVRQAIANYRMLLDRWNKDQVLSPDARATMGTAYNNMLLQAKEAYNLGVLNGPDYQILQEVIANPNSISSTLISKDALDKQASELDRLMQTVGQTSAAVNRQPLPGEVSPARLPQPPARKTFRDAGFNSPTEAVLEARALVKAKPYEKARVIRMLENIGIMDHGIK